MNSYGTRNCIQKDHEQYEISSICTFKQCQLQRYLCQKCREQGIHKHNQNNNDHLKDLNIFDLFVKKSYKQFGQRFAKKQLFLKNLINDLRLLQQPLQIICDHLCDILQSVNKEVKQRRQLISNYNFILLESNVLNDIVNMGDREIVLNKNSLDKINTFSLQLFQKAYDISQKLNDNPIIENTNETQFKQFCQIIGKEQDDQILISTQILSSSYQIQDVNAYNSDYFFNQANELKNQKKYEESLKFYDQAIQIKQDSGYYYHKADALKELKRYKEAISMFDKAIQKDQNAGYYYHKADCLRELKYYEDALMMFEEAIIRDPNPGYFYHKGEILRLLNRNEEMLELYERAIKLNPNYSNHYHKKAEILTSLKRYQEALQVYEQAFRLFNQNQNTQDQFQRKVQEITYILSQQNN